VQTLGEVPVELSLTPEADAALSEQAARTDHATVVRLLELLGEAMEAVRAGADARTRVELALVKAARPLVDGSMRALLARIERLEHARDVYEGPPQAAGGVARGETAADASDPRAAQPAVAEPAVAGETEPAGDGGMGERGPAAAVAQPAAAVAEPAAAVAEPAATVAPRAGAGVASARELGSVRELWPAVVELVRGENGLLAACIEEAQPVEVVEEELTIAFATTAQFHKKKAEDPTHRMALAEALRSVTGLSWRVCYELREVLPEGERGEARAGSQEEWVARFMQEFDAEDLRDPAGAVGAAGAADPVGATEGEAVTSGEKGV
jgi:DNA polymerase III subunit gamma/tau